MASAKATVRDVYSRRDLGEVRALLHTDEIGPRDSRFYILKPS